MKFDAVITELIERASFCEKAAQRMEKMIFSHHSYRIAIKQEYVDAYRSEAETYKAAADILRRQGV